MRAVSFVVSALLAGSAFAQAPVSVYTPAGRDLGVPTFINATVVRVDARRNTITFRSESGEVTLTTEGGAVSGLRRLRRGDEVMLGYRVASRSGRPVQVVTAILAGREMAERGLVAATSPAAVPVFSTVSGRVIRTDPAAGTITLVDAAGRTETLAVERSAAGVLGSVLPGDQIEASFVPGAPMATGGVIGAGGVLGTVNGLRPVTPTFVTGRVTGFDSATGVVRLQTPFGTSVFTLPVSRFDARTVRAGQDVRLDLAGRGTSTMVTGVSPLGGGTVAAAAMRGTFSMPLAATAGTRTALTSTGTGSVTAFATAGALAPTTTASLATLGLSAPAVNAGTSSAGAGTADVASTGTFTTPSSPFSAVIPSLPSVVGQLNVVPPPAAAPALAADVLPVGAARDLATRDYDSAVRTLALKANEIDAHWFRYRDGCLRTSALRADIDRNFYGSNRDREWFVLFTGDVRTPADDNCRQLLIEMTRMANDWRDMMTRVEDTARRNDVLPGAMRESRQRYRVEF